MITTVLRPPQEEPPRSAEPDKLARRLIDRDYLSYSSISTFQRCPLRFYFRYIRNQPEETLSASLVVGGSIHSAIEGHYRALLAGEQPLTVDDLVELYVEAWKAKATTPLLFGKNENEDTLRDLAHRVLDAFVKHPIAFPGGEILGIEEQLRGPLAPDVPDLFGRADLILLERDQVSVLDFKTARSRWTEAKISEAAAQLELYGELLAPLALACGNRPVRMGWVVVTKAKNPSIETHTLEPDARRLRRTINIVRKVWHAILGGHYVPSPSPLNCAACPYAGACRDWGTES